LSLEGLIGKRAGSKYDSKRSGAWNKVKLYQQGSFVIGGNTQPGGERKHVGALLGWRIRKGEAQVCWQSRHRIQRKTPEIAFGRTEQDRSQSLSIFQLARNRSRTGLRIYPAEMKRCIWVKPSIVCEVKFTEWTRDERLRQPVFLGIGEDKSASEVVREEAAGVRRSDQAEERKRP
jgi:bifunctional non-homologous end joining protein LigD